MVQAFSIQKFVMSFCEVERKEVKIPRKERIEKKMTPGSGKKYFFESVLYGLSQTIKPPVKNHFCTSLLAHNERINIRHDAIVYYNYLQLQYALYQHTSNSS